MLVGAYPFQDPQEPRNFRKSVDRIKAGMYNFPSKVRVSVECQDLLARIFRVDPKYRITVKVRCRPCAELHIVSQCSGLRGCGRRAK
eukprot:scaffold4547_cov335-Prasinococcus_capsulatus_cf.AAC.5